MGIILGEINLISCAPDYSFQDEIIKQTTEKLLNENKVILAAACGAGKTNMAIKIIENFLEVYPEARVLVLTHGQTILRTQFFERLQQVAPHLRFTSLEVMSAVPLDGKICITIPQSIINRESLPKFKLLIVDEAHHYYLSESIRNIKNKIQCEFELLLTGTPSVLMGNNVPIVSISSGELLNYNIISDPHIHLVQTEYDFEFSGHEEVSIGHFNKCISESNIEDSIKGLLNTIKNSSEKTLIACRSQKQAKFISNLLNKNQINHLASMSSNDRYAENVALFCTEKEHRILIVIKRGILGLDLPNLGLVIDMTCSLNPNVIFQLLSRVTRKSNCDKIYFKLIPKSWIIPTYTVMSFVVSLSIKEIYEGFVSKKRWQKTTKFLIKKEFLDRLKNGEWKNNPPKIGDLPAISSFKELNIHTNKSVFASTSFSYVLRHVSNKSFLELTFEECKKIALKYANITEWKRSKDPTFAYARKFGWLHDIFPRTKILWTFERCKQEYEKQGSLKNWKKNKSSSYAAAVRNKWLDLIRPQKSLTFEECKIRGDAFLSRKDWEKYDFHSFNIAEKNNWLQSIKSKINRTEGPFTYEQCLAYKKECNLTKKVWQDEHRPTYDAARKNGWLAQIKKDLGGDYRVIFKKKKEKK